MFAILGRPDAILGRPGAILGRPFCTRLTFASAPTRAAALGRSPPPTPPRRGLCIPHMSTAAFASSSFCRPRV
eukprot:3665934-Prymnesium_polylepis.1